MAMKSGVSSGVYHGHKEARTIREKNEEEVVAQPPLSASHGPRTSRKPRRIGACISYSR